YILGGLAVISVFLMLMATSVNPHFPYEYGNPIRDFAMPAFFRGDLAYNKDAYFGGGPIAGDSVAFNLGKLAGLPGVLQLLPLAAVWIAGALALIHELDLWPANPRRRLASASIALMIFALFMPPFTGLAERASDPAPAHGLLGRYYEGLHPSKFPPHIVRVDPLIDFNDISGLGALPFPSCVEWDGTVLIFRPGIYEFSIEADDSGWLTIDGRKVIADPGDRYRPQASGRIYLAQGRHRIQAGERNAAGDASMRLFWKPPGGALEIMPSAVLMPAKNS
ncbi:MAG: PA14 domain-containing protein, partial [Candidatus Binataceae bacterium]